MAGEIQNPEPWHLPHASRSTNIIRDQESRPARTKRQECGIGSRAIDEHRRGRRPRYGSAPKDVWSSGGVHSSFSWCEGILESYFGGGVGSIFAVFFFHIRTGRADVDPWIWIVVGDIPSAYLPLSDCETPAQVFRTYVDGMSRWVEFARKGQPGDATPPDVPPVDVPPTPEWAERLSQRLHGLTLIVKPFFEEEPDTIN